MNHCSSPIFWFLSFSLGLHIALAWSGILTLRKPPLPPVQVHHLTLTPCRSTLDKPQAMVAAAAPKAKAAPPIKQRPRPQLTEVKKTLPSPRLVPPPPTAAANAALARASRPGIADVQGQSNSRPTEKTGPDPDQIAINAERRYLGMLRARILQHRKYPPMSRQRGHEGVTQVRFTVAASGSLMGGVQMLNSSGYRLLDQQAQKCVQAAAPFPSFPAELHKSSLTVVVPIAFQLTGEDS
ncbi:MAG: TonB family protein [Desulfobacca sp.]|nr:TonB family protein [Desulfobacca sp.]